MVKLTQDHISVYIYIYSLVSIYNNLLKQRSRKVVRKVFKYLSKKM